MHRETASWQLGTRGGAVSASIPIWPGLAMNQPLGQDKKRSEQGPAVRYSEALGALRVYPQACFALWAAR